MRLALLALGAMALAGVGGFFTWRALQPPPPVKVVELPPRKVEPPPVAPPALAPPEPAAPIVLTVTAEPAAARFQLDGEPKDCNPCQLEGAAGKKGQLVASADGYLSKSLELVFDKPQQLAIVLAPEPKKAAAPGKKPPADKKRGSLSIDEQNPYR